MVYSALKPSRCLRWQFVPACRARDRDRVKDRGLKQDLCCGVADFSARASHDTGDADRSTLICDQEVLFVQDALFIVKRGYLLALFGPANLNATGQPVEVVGVKGLAHLKHHVVRDVDGYRN